MKYYDWGYSLFELLIVVIITITLLLIANITINRLTNKYYINCISRQMISDFYLARSEAIMLKTNVVISINKANNVLHTNGYYKIFIDNGKNNGIPNNWIQDGGEKLLVFRKMTKDIKLYKCTFYNNKTGYQANGSPLKQRWGSIYLRNKNKFYRMTLILTGRVKLYYSNNGKTWK